MCAIDLVEPPQQVFGRTVHIVTTRIVGEEIAERRTSQFVLEKIDFVEKQDNTRSHEPSRIHDRVKEDQTFHHSVLNRSVTC